MKFFNINKSVLNKNILYNKYLLYFIFVLSFGNFFIELMNSNMYFVAVYILIGFLTSFFHKNMIIILSVAVIFANVLNYGRASTLEGYEDEHEHAHENENENEQEEEQGKQQDDNTDNENTEKNDVDKVLGTESTDDDGIIDELVDQEIKKRKNKKKNTEIDTPKEKKPREKKKEEFTDQALLDMNYEKAEKLMNEQKDILKNLNEYKPFLETIQGIVKTTGINR